MRVGDCLELDIVYTWKLTPQKRIAIYLLSLYIQLMFEGSHLFLVLIDFVVSYTEALREFVNM